MDFANQMAALAATAPTVGSKKSAFRAVREIREEHGFSQQEKQRLVINALAMGCSTYDDLVEETKLAKPQVTTIIRAMEEAGTVELRQLGSGERGGRPTVYIHLVAAASG